MEKQAIMVGSTTMFAVTVPVNIIFDQWFDDPITDEPFVECQKFRMIETDGYYIVSIENFGERIEPSISFKCFIQLEDAWSYLEIYGIEKKDYVDVEEETDFGLEYD